MQFFKLICVSTILLACALAQPTVFDGGVINGASFTKGQVVAPGSVVSIFGSSLAAATTVGDTVPLSATIGATSVTFNGEPAPLYFVSAGQVNAQLPWDLPTSGTVTVVVKNGSSSSAGVAIPVAAMAPAIFSIPPGAGYAIAINADGSIAAPAGAIPGFPTHPAKAGDAVILYANGLGPVGTDGIHPSAPSFGAASLDATRYTLTAPTLLVGGKQAQLIFSGLSPQFAGINQLNFVVPSVTPGSSVPIQLSAGGITSTDQVVIAIQ